MYELKLDEVEKVSGGNYLVKNIVGGLVYDAVKFGVVEASSYIGRALGRAAHGAIVAHTDEEFAKQVKKP